MRHPRRLPRTPFPQDESATLYILLQAKLLTMPQLSSSDLRTIRRAGLALLIYLVLFFGFKAWRRLESTRTAYAQLVTRLEREQREARNAETKVMLFEKLRERYGLDPRRLPKETLVAEASSAIQKAAREGGFELGPMRETPGRANARELSSIQFEGAGPLPAALALVHKLQTLGYPVVIDSLQVTQDASRPGQLKLNVAVVILNFDQWKGNEVPNA